MAESKKKPGSFSRRHATAAAHEEARAKYLAAKATKSEDAKARAAARKMRTPAEQLAALDARLGKGQGAASERARLQTPITHR